MPRRGARSVPAGYAWRGMRNGMVAGIGAAPAAAARAAAPPAVTPAVVLTGPDPLDRLAAPLDRQLQGVARGFGRVLEERREHELVPGECRLEPLAARIGLARRRKPV